jgi:hypothetical protein
MSAGMDEGPRTGMTTVLAGAGIGFSSAETSFASRFETWKNRGRTSAMFSAPDLRQLDDTREAKPPVPERLHDLGVALNELSGRHPVKGSALRQAQIAVQVVEQR